MTVKVKIGSEVLAGDVTSLPISVWADQIRSQEVMIFFLNGKEYRFFVSKGGKLAVTKPQ